MSELQDLSALIRSNTPLIVIETPDEARVVDLFRHVLSNVWRALYRWSITEGLRRVDLDREDPAETAPDHQHHAAGDEGRRPARHLPAARRACPTSATPAPSACCARSSSAAAASSHTVVLVGNKIELPPELEALAVRFALQLPDENALLKMVEDEAGLYQRENGGRRVEVDKAGLCGRSCATCAA